MISDYFGFICDAFRIFRLDVKKKSSKHLLKGGVLDILRNYDMFCIKYHWYLNTYTPINVFLYAKKGFHSVSMGDHLME